VITFDSESMSDDWIFFVQVCPFARQPDKFVAMFKMCVISAILHYIHNTSRETKVPECFLCLIH